MITPFLNEEGSLLVRLLLAHFISDFFLQSDRAVKSKKEKLLRSGALYGHILITALVAWVFLWNTKYWKAVLIIAASHLLIDVAKGYADKIAVKAPGRRKDIWLFTIDQLMHIGVITWVWLDLIDGYQRMSILVHRTLPAYELLLRVLGYVILVGPVTYMIRFLTQRWSEHLDAREGLQDAGKWIGILERILILTLLYIQQYTAIGFLVAAKSILRLIDKPEPVPGDSPGKTAFNARKHTEYVLIGTFLSFGFAMITGLIINWLLQL